eukprot:m.58313 g.58313  ORF g.58313 m.58313 type:complete len:61 (+) comp15641_c0_seq5:80-262(+)
MQVADRRDVKTTEHAGMHQYSCQERAYPGGMMLLRYVREYDWTTPMLIPYTTPSASTSYP